MRTQLDRIETEVTSVYTSVPVRIQGGMRTCDIPLGGPSKVFLQLEALPGGSPLSNCRLQARPDDRAAWATIIEGAGFSDPDGNPWLTWIGGNPHELVPGSMAHMALDMEALDALRLQVKTISDTAIVQMGGTVTTSD